MPLWGQVFPQSRQEPKIVAFVSRNGRLELTENASDRVTDAPSCLRRRSDCSWRRRSPASSAAAVKMMIRTRHLHCVRIMPHRAPAARAQRIDCNSTWLSSTWFNSAQLTLARFNMVRLSTTQLGSTQLNSTQLNLARLHFSTSLGAQNQLVAIGG